MTGIRRLAGVLLLTALAAGVTTPSWSQSLEREAYVAVTDDAGEPVAGLTEEHFEVREDGVAREVLRVRRATEPMQIVLLVDNTQASDSAIPDIRRALTAFVEELGGDHEIGLATFGERPTLRVSGTTDVAAIEEGIGRIFAMPNAGSYLLDAIAETTRGFARREAPRPVIVAITVEGTEFSYANDQHVIRDLVSTRTPLYVMAVPLGGRSSPLGSVEERNRAIVFDRGTKESGGRLIELLSDTALPERMGRLARTLGMQYLVTYARPDALVPPERLTVTVSRPGLEATATPALPLGES